MKIAQSDPHAEKTLSTKQGGGSYLVDRHHKTMRRKYGVSGDQQTHFTNYYFSRKLFRCLHALTWRTL